MKKFFILLTTLLLLCINYVSADTTVSYDTGNLTYTDNVLYLNNYVHNAGDYDTGNGFSIECDGDLTINLEGDNYIYGEGISVLGDLTFTGSGTLFIENIEVWGSNLTINSGDITIDMTSGGDYYIPPIYRPNSVYYDNGGNKEYLRYDVSGYYIDYINQNTIDTIVLSKGHELGDLNNLYLNTPLFDNWSSREFVNVSGYAYDANDNTDNVIYDSSSLTYKVTYKDNTINEDKIIRMVLSKEELGKDISYEVLKAKNIDGINEGDTLYPTDYIGQEESYEDTVGTGTASGAAMLYFKNTSNDYYLKLKVVGLNGSHRYININYVEENNNNTNTNNNNDIKIHEFKIPNTGVRK